MGGQQIAFRRKVLAAEAVHPSETVGIELRGQDVGGIQCEVEGEYELESMSSLAPGC